MKKLSILSFLLVSTFVALSQPIPTPPTDGTDDGSTNTSSGLTVSGFVLTEDGTPVPDVRVKLRNHTENTDENGFYVFTDVKPGRYTVKANAKRTKIRPPHQNIVVSDSDVTDVNFVAKLKGK